MGKKIDTTIETDLKVKELWDQKKGARVISKELGISRWTVQQVYKKLGIYDVGRKTPRLSIPKEKQCIDCKNIKLISEFRKYIVKKNNRTVHEGRCLICENKYNHEQNIKRYQNNKQWYVDYRENNKDHINEVRKNRIDTDPTFKLRLMVSSAINQQFRKQNGVSKGGSIIDGLPYTMEQLEAHIEKQFKEPGNEWMTWENWGKYDIKTWDDNDKTTWTWNLDHIEPASRFKYESMKDEEFQLCWALKNLRPYSAKQNLIDSARKGHNKT